MNTESNIIKKTFWKTTTGLILKIAGAIGAVTTIVTFGIQTYTYATGLKDEQIKNKATAIIEQFYKLDSIHKCDQMAELFTPIVEDYFDKSHFTKDQITNDCIAYRSKWPYYTYDIDYTSLVVKKTERKTYQATYKLMYKVKKKESDDWKNFPLSIIIDFNEQFKIQSIYEIKK